jgi:hypothetical protein
MADLRSAISDYSPELAEAAREERAHFVSKIVTDAAVDDKTVPQKFTDLYGEMIEIAFVKGALWQERQ